MVRDAPSSLRSATGRSPVRHRQSPRYLRSKYGVPYRRLDAHDLLGIYAVLRSHSICCEVALYMLWGRTLVSLVSMLSRYLRSKYGVPYRRRDTHDLFI